MSEEISQTLSPEKQALLKIRELKRQLSVATAGDGSGPIAIVSMACRFPRRSSTPELFWDCLMQRSDEVSEIPTDRWDLDAFYDEDAEAPGKMYARRGVFLDDIDQMDPEFFGISPREATWVDPQQRLLMEVGWEAIERACWQAERIGEQTGVFVGWMHNDYQNEASDSFLNLNPYIATGAAGSFLCGRLAYHLGLRGPSVAIDTACSSSLVALHLACQSLQRRDCDRALVGGVNAIVSPTTNILTCKLKALSPRGHSRAFDAAADGYLRGEGCGVVTLRRLEDAQRDGDPVIGVIRGSAIGHNGSSSGLTVPNPTAQEAVIRQAVSRAGVQPADVAYLEAHGTGTELGDPVEIKAAAAALATGRVSSRPLMVGSVKTNIGHLEAAAGIAGLIKVLLAMQHDRLPAQLNFENPNPHIPWDQLPLKIVTEATPWPEGRKRIAGVSAFGMSGTNAHVVVEAPEQFCDGELATQVPTDRGAEAPASNEPSDSTAASPVFIALSGKSNEVVEILSGRLASKLTSEPTLPLADVGFTTCVGRSHFDHRATVVADSRAEAINSLKSLARSGNSPSLCRGHGRQTPKVAWQFTGQGSQYVGMARVLYDRQSIFREVIHDCDRRLKDWRGQSLIDVLFQDDSQIHETTWTQPAIFAMQMGLVRLLESWGLQPDAVLGHSVGQYAAACVAGILSWEEGLHLISERGRLIGQLSKGGRMLAAFASAADVQELLTAIPGVSLAATNGTHVVVSGPQTEIERAEKALRDRGFSTKTLKTSHAFHSSLMDPILGEFERIADTVSFRAGSLPLACNVTGQCLQPDQVLDGAYWSRHIRQPVRYADDVDAIGKLGCNVLLEIGPQAVLTQMAAATWRHGADGLVSCLQKGRSDEQSLLQAVAELYVRGAQPNFEAIYADRHCRRVVLPTYPFQRRRFWGPDKPSAFHSQSHTAHPLLGVRLSLAGLEGELRHQSEIEPDSPPWLPDHQVMGQVVVPGASFVEMALAASPGCDLLNINFEQPLKPSGRTSLQTVVKSSPNEVAAETERSIEIFSRDASGSDWVRHFRAELVEGGDRRAEAVEPAKLAAACPQSASPEEFYRNLQDLDLHYGTAFQTVESLRYSDNEVVAHLRTTGDVRGFTIPPTLLDGALHCLAVGLLNEGTDDLFLPVGIGRVAVAEAIETEAWCHGRWKESEGPIRTADLTLFTEAGNVVAKLHDVAVKRISRATLRRLGKTGPGQFLYEVSWQPFRLPASTDDATQWIVASSLRPRTANNGDAGDNSTLASKVAAELARRGHDAIEIGTCPSAALTQISESRFQMAGDTPQDWADLWELLSAESAFEPDGIVWVLDDDVTFENSNGAGSSIEPLDGAKMNCQGLLSLIDVLRQRSRSRLRCGLQLVTSDAIAINSRSLTEPPQSQYWGLGRVIGAEEPGLRCRLIDVSVDAEDAGELREIDHAAATVADILLTETADSQLAVRDQRLLVPRVARLPRKNTPADDALVKPDVSYLISGGLGMLGQQAAKWLAEQGASQVVLVSRRSPDAATIDFLDAIRAVGCDVVVHPADIGSRDDVSQLVRRFGVDLLPLAGVIHAAGVLDDGLLGDQNWKRFQAVLKPKVLGAIHLHEFTKSMPLDFFVLYSSAASVLGSPGQSNYATANAYLDGLAWRRRAEGLPGLSVNWGPWTLGMADDERTIKRLELQGIAPLSVADAHSALQELLESNVAQSLVLDVDWRRMKVGMGGELPAILSEMGPSKSSTKAAESALVAKLREVGGGERKELLIGAIQEILSRVLSTSEDPETDRPLIEMGLDSLMAVEFGSELQMLLGEQYAIRPTMLFDHPTIDAIADHVLDLLSGDSESEQDVGLLPTEPQIVKTDGGREDVAIIGMSCRFPGARNIHEFWDNLLSGVDSVSEIPADRWDVDRFHSPEREAGKMYSREGGFVDDIGEFDAAFFNISDDEAYWIDPQHRMLLENSYQALEDAGIATHPLPDANVGVFMGMMGQDYAFLPSLDDVETVRAFQGAGFSHSAGVGRISYVFGFQGPSVAIDTASSSSLVALMQAVRSLQEGNCNLALAGGANAILAPANSLLLSNTSLLSPDGRCKSFSAQADGFGRGEGCGVVVLKRLSDAVRDGDRVMAVVRGGAVVHNGFSGGITATNGKAQARVISQALRDADVAPSEVQYLEAHGTGTAFGDPIELAAAAGVYGRGRPAEQPLLVGSVKANISHLEAAGGVSGLIKTVLALHYGVIPPQIHCEPPSPHISWDRLPVKLATEKCKWPDVRRRTAGVTALGLIGTNAHVVLSSADPEELAGAKARSSGSQGAATLQPSAHALVLSARSNEALSQLASDYLGHLSKHPEIEVADFCHTLAVGRRHYEYRAAAAVRSREDLTNALNEIANTSWTTRLADVDGNHPKNGATSASQANGSTRVSGQSPNDCELVARGRSVSTLAVGWFFIGCSDASFQQARELYRVEPEFRAAIDMLDRRLVEHCRASATTARSLTGWFEQDRDVQPTDVHRFAVQAGLAHLWKAWGLEPDVVCGDGVGQYAASCVAESLSWDDAVLLIFEREKVLTPDGDLPRRTAPALSEAELSPAVREQLERFEQFADTMNYYPPSLPLICSLSGEVVPVHQSLGGSYWRRHCWQQSSVVELGDALDEQQCDFLLYMGPPPAEDAADRQARGDASAVKLASLSQERDAGYRIFESLTRLYAGGFDPDFKAVDRHSQRKRLSLPTYAFQKRRYWITELPDRMRAREQSPVESPQASL